MRSEGVRVCREGIALIFYLKFSVSKLSIPSHVHRV